jgi:hypothetical protein
MSSGERSTFLVEVFDILFIMILCFVTLLATMLMRGKVIVGSGSGGGLTYDFGLASFAFTSIFLAIYLFYIIRHSEAELKSFYAGHYDRKEKLHSDNIQEGRTGGDQG